MLSFFWTSKTLPSGWIRTTALRSLAATEIALRIKVRPSAPSSKMLCVISAGLAGAAVRADGQSPDGASRRVSDVRRLVPCLSKNDTVGGERLLGFAIGQGSAHAARSARRSALGRPPARCVDSPAPAAGDIKIAVLVEGDAVGAFAVSVAKVSAIPGFSESSLRLANAQHFFKAARRSDKDHRPELKTIARNIGARLLAADVPFLTRPTTTSLGIFGSMPDVASSPDYRHKRLSSRVGGESSRR